MVFGPDEPNRTALRVIGALVVIPSFIGSFIMIRCALQRNRTTWVNLILSIAILNFLYSIANLMSFYNHGERTQEDITPLCYIEATIRLWTFRLPLFLAVCIAVLCYISVKSEFYQKEENKRSFFYKCLLTGSVICLFMNLLPAFLPDSVKYTNDYLCCTILFETSLDWYWKFLIDLLDETGIILIGIIVTIYCYYKTYQIQKQSQFSRIIPQSKINKLFWYPGVLLVLFIAGVVDRIAQVFSQKPVFGVQIFYLVFTHSAGWINALLCRIPKESSHSTPNDSAPNDSISNDPIPNDSIPNDSTRTHLLHP